VSVKIIQGDCIEVAKCYYNGCALTDVDIEQDYQIDDQTVCRDCYESWRDDNESECPFCCNYFLEEDLSDVFVLWDPEIGQPGVYRPLSSPFYSQPPIGCPSMWDSAVERIGSLMPNFAIDIVGCAAAFVCKECNQR
jgi:hypothetical protein